MEDYANFLKKMKKLILYIIDFYDNSVIKSKVYFFNCIVWSKNCKPIIIITYDKCTFFANNGVWKV